MINEYTAKQYCSEDISLIENYELAIADTTQTWEIHHRRGTIYSSKDLKEIGEYYNRPAAELIFLTLSAHRQLHLKGVPKSEATKKAISDGKKGIPLSEATKKAIGEAHKGVPLSEDHKKALSDALKGVNAKKVLQFTKSRELIKEWPSASEASRELGISQTNICGCCNGKRKSAGGYVWRYA